jgi:hypothetical protein
MSCLVGECLVTSNAAIQLQAINSKARIRAAALDLEGTELRWLPRTSRLTVASASYAAAVDASPPSIAPARQLRAHVRHRRKYSD